MGKKSKKRVRADPRIQPGDEYTPIPENVGKLPAVRQQSFWEKARYSTYFERVGKEEWLQNCVALGSLEDFDLAYEIGPPNYYTEEKLISAESRKGMAYWHQKCFPDHNTCAEPMKFIPLKPKKPLKDLTLEQLRQRILDGETGCPGEDTEEIRHLVAKYKYEKEMLGTGQVRKTNRTTTNMR